MRLGCSFELGLQSSEGWTGAGGSSPFGGLFTRLTEQSLEAVLHSSPHGPLPRLLQCPPDLKVGLPQSESPKKANCVGFLLL